MNPISRVQLSLLIIGLLAGASVAEEIEPTWESMAVHYQVPQWFVDGKIGVWMHWGHFFRCR